MKLDYKNILKILAERKKENKVSKEKNPFSAFDLAKELKERKDRNKQILEELRN